MGSIGAFMFHVVGIVVLAYIAIAIAAVSVPRRPRSTGRRRHTHEGYVRAGGSRVDTNHRGE